jgi:hypothetical protein
VAVEADGGTPSGPRDLAALVDPVAPGAFLAAWFERRPLVCRRDAPDHFAGLLTPDDVAALVAGGNLRHTECRLARDGKALPRALVAWQASAGDEAPVDAARVLAEHRAGATLILDGLHHRWPPLARLCRALEATFAHPFQANVYLTPAEARGFGPHFDAHDVFVLQLHGSKRWRVYERPLPWPRKTGTEPLGDRAVAEEVVLRAGDSLYLPRGWFHDADAGREASLHVTLGLLATTWADALALAVERIPALRRALPPGFAFGEASALAEGWRQALASLAALPVADVHDDLAGRFVARRRPLVEAALGDPARDLGLDTAVARGPGVIHRVVVRDERVTLEFDGRALSFPAFCAADVRFAGTGARFRPRDLPGDLDDDGRLVLVRRLLREGFLQRVA